MPRIYVASLSDYNNSHLHGDWIDLDEVTDRQELDERIAAMLRGSKFPNVLVACPKCIGGEQCDTCGGSGQVRSAEEWAIHDYDDFGGLSLGEHPDLDAVIEHAEMLSEHGDAWIAYQDVVSGDGSSDDFEERYQGEYDTAAAWAESFLEESGQLERIPEELRTYFDFEAYARDARLGGDVSFVRVDGQLHVFFS